MHSVKENSNKITLITGIPRSGTSLVASIISSSSNNLCFSEPSFIKEIKKKTDTAEKVAAQINQFISFLRQSILDGQPIKVRLNQNNQIPENYFSRDKGVIEAVTKEEALVVKRSEADAHIFIKNNLFFTSCLDQLINHFEVIAIIRNPIATIGSWRSLNLPVSKGIVKSGLKYSQSLRQIKESNLLLKQIKIVDWFYKSYQKNKSSIYLLRYEDIVNSPEKCLSQWSKVSNDKLKLKSKNESSYYALSNNEISLIKTKSKLYNEIYADG